MNEQFYLQPSITAVLDPDGIIVSRNALPATSESYDRACEILASDSHIDIDLATVILREDCLNSTKNGVYSCMWHAHGLASVLKRPVVSTYPDFNHRYRSLFNRECHPRTTSTFKTDTRILIMWTTTKRNQNPHTWSPNHSVPCYESTSAISSPHLKPSSGHQTVEATATSKQPPLRKEPNPTPKQLGTSPNPSSTSCPTPYHTCSSTEFRSPSPVAVPKQFPSSVTKAAPCNPPGKQFPFQIPPRRQPQASRGTSPGLTYSSVTKTSLVSPPQEQPSSTVTPSKLPASYFAYRAVPFPSRSPKAVPFPIRFANKSAFLLTEPRHISTLPSHRHKWYTLEVLICSPKAVPFPSSREQQS